MMVSSMALRAPPKKGSRARMSSWVDIPRGPLVPGDCMPCPVISTVRNSVALAQYAHAALFDDAGDQTFQLYRSARFRKPWLTFQRLNQSAAQSDYSLDHIA
jgi:hypothetical protein